eukprot:338793-Pelagomonas_calceolata.AAC.3
MVAGSRAEEMSMSVFEFYMSSPSSYCGESETYSAGHASGRTGYRFVPLASAMDLLDQPCIDVDWFMHMT